jgi:glycosyltransferase involved in cell wall biosynthesis
MAARARTADASDLPPPQGAAAGSAGAARPVRASIVSINYAPELTGIGVYSTGLAEHLARAGMAATVHTAFPYYPAWAKRAADRRTLFRREAAGGVAVRRSYVYVPARPTALRRILHELSFAASASLGYLFAPRADVTVVVSPPLALGLAIGLLARLKRSPLVLHVQDLQPDTAIELGMLPGGGAIARALHALERASYRLADRVAVISDGIAERLRAKGVPQTKVFVFRNWADTDRVVPGTCATRYRADWNLGARTVVLYAGNLGVKQGLDVLLDAAAILDRSRRDVALVIVGDGGERRRLVERARARPREPAVSPAATRRADVRAARHRRRGGGDPAAGRPGRGDAVEARQPPLQRAAGGRRRRRRERACPHGAGGRLRRGGAAGGSRRARRRDRPSRRCARAARAPRRERAALRRRVPRPPGDPRRIRRPARRARGRDPPQRAQRGLIRAPRAIHIPATILQSG